VEETVRLNEELTARRKALEALLAEWEQVANRLKRIPDGGSYSCAASAVRFRARR